MLFYVCNIIINYNSKCTHPSYGARLMLCWTDFGFLWHQDQRGYKKISYTENAFPSPTLLLSRLVLYIYIFNLLVRFTKRFGEIRFKQKYTKYWIKSCNCSILFYFSFIILSSACTYGWNVFVIWTFQTRKIFTW